MKLQEVVDYTKEKKSNPRPAVRRRPVKSSRKKQVSRVKSPKHSTGRDGHGHVGEMMSKQECPKGERKQSNGRGAVATERNKQAEPIPQRGN
jgi:hypothetical protein